MTEFQIKEEIERQNIEYLFDSYLQNHGCSNLFLTPVSSYAHYDASFNYGEVRIVCEYKRRSLKTTDRSDSLIEYPKFSNLFPYHDRSGCTVIYLIEYDDYYAFFNLSRIYDHDQALSLPLHHYFYSKQCTKTTAQDYNHSETDKWVRGMQFYDASFLTKDFQFRTYQDLIKTIS